MHMMNSTNKSGSFCLNNKHVDVTKYPIKMSSVRRHGGVSHGSV